jgi:hypothetical protein
MKIPVIPDDEASRVSRLQSFWITLSDCGAKGDMLLVRS